MSAIKFSEGRSWLNGSKAPVEECPDPNPTFSDALEITMRELRERTFKCIQNLIKHCITLCIALVY
jgi:hypothetical protein